MLHSDQKLDRKFYNANITKKNWSTICDSFFCERLIFLVYATKGGGPLNFPRVFAWDGIVHIQKIWAF